ncbi:MAG TPA: nitroreductase family protein [Acidimicrobiales bacterium]|nr:nitroreductase family protein [Acidimicrobiales bacterium]
MTDLPPSVDLLDTLRSTAAIREFEDTPVDDTTLRRILDTARFAPNGGNAQSWRVVVLRDPEKRRAMRDLYLEGWRLYLAMRAAGLRPWAPVTDRSKEAEAVAQARVDDDANGRPFLGEFPEHLDEAPVLLLLLADLRLLAAVDRDLDRYTFIGGASVYPFAWSLLLAARAEGLGGVITTMPVYREDAVKELLGVPAEFAVAGLLALGHPLHQPTRLTRKSVDEFTTVDTFDGPALG